MRPPLLCRLVLVGSVLLAASARADDAPRFARRWFYAMHNLQVEKNADDLVALIGRAGKAGYNGVVLADYKLNVLDRVPEHYFKNVARVKEAAEKAGLEIIPAVFPIGYSSGLLAHDPNLAEGVPVKDAPFVVKDGEAVLDREAAPPLANGDLEEVKGDRFAGFTFQDDPGKTTFADREVVHSGKVSCRMQDAGSGSANGNCRLAQRVKLRPWACYRFSAWVKTKDLKPAGFRLLALGKEGRPLTFIDEGGVKPTQDWQRVEVVFNSLDQSEATLYAGQWGGRTGTLWLDGLALEELALVNVLRRDGCPLTVASADGKTVYEEGKDFLPLRDAKLGQEPYAGEYSFRHGGPALQLTSASRIKDGDRLRVSWYHPILVHGEQVMCCLSEEKVYDLLRDQARRVHDLLRPKAWFFGHDEIRVAGWCRSCAATKKTPGELLADNIARCVKIVKEIDPRAEVVVWSDMFDPLHNAVDKYYLVNGSLEGSWKGLPEGTIVANWNGGKAEKSLKRFADRGYPQIIAGYYDDGVDNFEKWAAAARGVPKVVGFLYTTWRGKYDDLEAYGARMRGEGRP
jgi:hypothetical protein